MNQFVRVFQERESLMVIDGHRYLNLTAMSIVSLFENIFDSLYGVLI